MSTLRICTVYPDLLGTYGDSGNGEILAARARWRGVDVEFFDARSPDALPVADLYSIGGGEDGPQVLAAERLAADGGLARAVEQGAVIFAVCAGFQVIGHRFPDGHGRLHDGLGLLDVETVKGVGARAVGEVAVAVPSAADGGLDLPMLSGFENHGGVTTLGSGVEPLGKVVAGIGNGAGDQTEGAICGRIIGTYLHGPVLARNAALADLLLEWATGTHLETIDDTGPEDLRRERLGHLSIT